MEKGKELLKAVKNVLEIKDKKKGVFAEKASHYQKFKKLLGEEQELTRNLNDAIEELEKYRT